MRVRPGTILDKTDEFTEKIFKINIISHFTMIREFMPEMVRKNKGHIVGIASMASFVAPAGIVDYAATKAAVLALHEGLLSSRNSQSDSDADRPYRPQPRN